MKEKHYKKSTSNLTLKEISRVERLFEKAGYVTNKDYKINYFSNNSEVFIMNDSLKKEFKAFLNI